MRAETHAVFFQIYIWVGLVVWLSAAALVFIYLDLFYKGLPWAIAVGVYLLLLWMIWNLPVRCNQPGCNGRMRKTLSQGASLEARLRYRCTRCEDVYDQDIWALSGHSSEP